MKVVHVIKRVETIDNDIKELRKLEKSLSRDKSFSTPIYMTIEKQINILLGERIKLLDLRISNPPENLVAEIQGETPELETEILPSVPEPKKTVKKTKPKQQKAESSPAREIEVPDFDEMPMLTQDQIDSKFESMQKTETARTKEEKATHLSTPEPVEEKEEDDDHKKSSYEENSIKLLDIALEKGSLNRKTIEKDKKVKFFRENFPST